jgi:hypothetical protein
MTLRQYIGLLERQPKPRDFSKELVATLRNAAQQVKETNTVGNAKFKTLTVSLAYGAMWDLTGGANIPISLVTIGPNLDHNRADTQTIKLTFENQTAGSSNNPR